MKDNLPLPDRIRDAPELSMGLELYYAAFFDLHTGRHIGMAEGPISWVQIDDYCDRLSLCEDQKESMHYLIRLLDNAYLEWRNKKTSSNIEKQKRR